MALLGNSEQPALGSVIGETPEIQRVQQIIRVAASTSHPVLIVGEPGTGKEVIARAIHRMSHQSEAAFRVRSCMTIRCVDLEREWAAGSSVPKTLFLDHIECLNLEIQGRLLQIIQKAETHYERGSGPATPRLIAATSVDLREAVNAGTFRRDLYFRLTAVTLKMPPLRERLADIPLLAGYFLREFSETPADYRLSDAALHSLLAHSWPGNVRELKTCLENACEAASRRVITVADLPAEMRRSGNDSSNILSLDELDAEPSKEPSDANGLKKRDETAYPGFSSHLLDTPR